MKILKYYDKYIGEDEYHRGFNCTVPAQQWSIISKNAKYKIGDIVLTNFHNKIMEITDIDFINNNIIQYECFDEYDYVYLQENNIIKKLIDEEIEIYKNMRKYNL